MRAQVPLHVRAQAEAWELPREEVQLLSLIAEGQGGMVYQCRWRCGGLALVCVRALCCCSARDDMRLVSSCECDAAVSCDPRALSTKVEG